MQDAQNFPVASEAMPPAGKGLQDRQFHRPLFAIGWGWTRFWLLALAALLIGCAPRRLQRRLLRGVWFREGRGPRYFHDLASICEIFGRGECVLLVGILIWQLDRSRRWAVPGVMATALLSGLAADGIKMLIARVRPHHFDLLENVWSGFGPWLPLGSLGSAHQSFPSAHTATAVGLAVALMCVYPAARGLFCVLPLLVAYQRVDSGADFPSDVLCGAAAGCLVAATTLRLRWLNQDYALWFWGRIGGIGPSRTHAPRGNALDGRSAAP